jgi:hypothetical protein
VQESSGLIPAACAGFVERKLVKNSWFWKYHRITFTVWPRFLARILCPHLRAEIVGIVRDKGGKFLYSLGCCSDCNKWFRFEKELDLARKLTRGNRHTEWIPESPF